MEIGGNTAHVSVAVTRIPMHLVVGGKNRIPIHLGFVLAVRREPHNLGTVGRDVTDLHVLDIGCRRFTGQRREVVGRKGRIHQPAGRIAFAAGVDGHNLEVIGGTVLQPLHVDSMLDSGNRICRHTRIGARFLITVEDHGLATNILIDIHDSRIIAYIANFHVHLRWSAVTVFFVNGQGSSGKEHGRTVDTSFGQMVIFPAQGTRRPTVRTACTRSHPTKQSSHGRVVNIGRTRHILAFGVCRTVVRMGIVLVADTQQEGHIPGVHAKHVVQLIDSQLLHLSRVPILDTLLRELHTFQILGHIGIGKHFKNIARLITVVNPGLVCLHIVPDVTIRKIVRIEQARKGNSIAARTRQNAQVCCQQVSYIFSIFQTGLIIDTILEAGFGIPQEQLVKAIKRIGVSIRPAGVLAGFTHAVTAPGHPTAIEKSSSTFLFHTDGLIFHGVIQVRHIRTCRIIGRIMESNSGKGQVVVRFIVAVVCRTRPTIGHLVVNVGFSTIVGSRTKGLFLQLQVLGKFVKFLGYHKAAVCKGLVIDGVVLRENGKARSNLTGNVGTQLSQTNITFMGAATTDNARRQGILVFGPTPPAVVSTKVTHRNRHIVNNAVCKVISPQEEIGSVLGLAQDVGNTIGIHRLAVVVSIIVVVPIGVRTGHDGKHHKGISLSLGFFQVVTAVVPAALQGTLFSNKTGHTISTRHELATAVLGVARGMEPGFRIAGAVDTVKLDGGIAHHGIHTVTNDEGRRIFLANKNSQALVLRKRKSGKTTHADKARRPCSRHLVTFLVCRSRIGTRRDFPGGFRVKTGILEGPASSNCFPF